MAGKYGGLCKAIPNEDMKRGRFYYGYYSLGHEGFDYKNMKR